MSAISEKVRKAIFAKTNVGAVVGASKLTAIYSDKAHEGATFPYGVFNRQGSEPVEYAFNTTQILESDLWQFRVYADEDSSTTKEPQELAEDLLAVWISTLGNSLTLTGNTVVWCARDNDLPNTDTQQANRWVYGRGALVRIAAE